MRGLLVDWKGKIEVFLEFMLIGTASSYSKSPKFYYSSCLSSNKKKLQSKLRLLKEKFSPDDWCVGGDINVVR